MGLNKSLLFDRTRMQALKEHRPELLERVAAEEAAKKKRAEVSMVVVCTWCRWAASDGWSTGTMPASHATAFSTLLDHTFGCC